MGTMTVKIEVKESVSYSLTGNEKETLYDAMQLISDLRDTNYIGGASYERTRAINSELLSIQGNLRRILEGSMIKTREDEK